MFTFTFDDGLKMENERNNDDSNKRQGHIEEWKEENVNNFNGEQKTCTINVNKQSIEEITTYIHQIQST